MQSMIALQSLFGGAQGDQLVKRVFATFAFEFSALDEVDTGAALENANGTGSDDDAAIGSLFCLGFEAGSEVDRVADDSEVKLAKP